MGTGEGAAAAPNRSTVDGGQQHEHASGVHRTVRWAAAHRIIEEALERNWDGTLALLYGECADKDALERLERAEEWLKDRPAEAELLLTLGRLCVQRELWGKAQSYLEASLATQPTQAAHIALAKLYERLGRPAEAGRHFRASADLAQGAPG